MTSASETALATCELCGSERSSSIVFEARDYEYGVLGTWALARCGRCGLHYQAPLPAAEAIPGFYPRSYSSYEDGVASRLPSVMGSLFSFAYWVDARRASRLLGPGARVLDIGCGAGAALAALARFRPDLELHGVELAPEAAKRARSLGFDVREGDLLDGPYEPASFDLVRMGHVVEHFRDPRKVLAKAHEILRPGGVLFGETPNVACWDFRIFGRFWGALHFPRHLVLFSEATLRRACESAGFAEVAIQPRLRTVGWSTAIQNLLVDKLGLKVPPTGRVWWYPLLVVLCLPLTVLQSLASRPGTVAFTARKAKSSSS